MSERLKESIIEYIKESGIPLEIDATTRLREHDWKIRNQAYYYDDDSNKARTVDIYAAKLNVLSNKKIVDRLITTLLIECKTSEHAWIFFSEEYEHSPDHLMGYLTWLKKIIAPSIERDFKKHELLLGNYSHYFWHENERIAVIGDVTHKGKDAMYEACCQATKALDYYRTSLTDIIEHTPIVPYSIFYPIILFDGNMFEINKNGDDLEINEIKYFSYIFSGVANEYETFLVEIVHKDYFEDYLTVLDREITAMCEKLEEIEE